MSRLGHLGAQLYRGDVSYEFIERRKVWYTLSAVILLISIASLMFRGLTLGIEFRGGAEFRVKSPTVTESTVLSTVQDVIGSGNEIVVQTVGPNTVRAQKMAVYMLVTMPRISVMPKPFTWSVPMK